MIAKMPINSFHYLGYRCKNNYTNRERIAQCEMKEQYYIVKAL